MGKLNSLSIENIKGIQSKSFVLDLYPNKPSIFVAPNGFGKSSIAIGFKSLNNSRINLEEKHHYKGDLANLSELKVNFCETEYTANNTSNTLLSIFDVYVINSSVIAKSTGRRMGSFTSSSASLEVSSVTLIDTIPKKVDFKYSYSDEKNSFGVNGKILPNATSLIGNLEFLYQFDKQIDTLAFSKALTYKRPIKAIIDEINLQSGSTEQIKTWIKANCKHKLTAIEELNKLAQIIKAVSEEECLESFLQAIQIANLSQTSTFKDAISYKLYTKDKAFFDELLGSFNTTRHTIKTKEEGKASKKSLVVHFPKADDVSNGQRDILTFIAHMQRARRKFKKNNCILIVDEIFDYLDDANLVAFQYYVTRIIEDFKSEGRNIFPILLTHLDPAYFRHFCFSKHKLQIRYLAKNSASISSAALNLVKLRDDPSIKDKVSKHHFHYHPQDENLESEFQALGLRKNWGKSHSFYSYIKEEREKYSRNEDYDAIAVLLAVRVKIEQLAFDRLTDATQQAGFHNEHGTGKKLDYCSELGVDIPETHFLLKIIYNDDLHDHNGKDIETPLRSKLSNVTFKNIITEIFPTC